MKSDGQLMTISTGVHRGGTEEPFAAIRCTHPSESVKFRGGVNRIETLPKQRKERGGSRKTPDLAHPDPKEIGQWIQRFHHTTGKTVDPIETGHLSRDAACRQHRIHKNLSRQC